MLLLSTAVALLTVSPSQTLKWFQLGQETTLVTLVTLGSEVTGSMGVQQEFTLAYYTGVCVCDGERSAGPNPRKWPLISPKGLGALWRTVAYAYEMISQAVDRKIGRDSMDSGVVFWCLSCFWDQ